MAVYYKPQSPIQSGEDFIYPITTADQVIVDKDTRLNAVGVYLKNIDNSTDTTVYGNNATTLGGVAAEDYALKTDTAPDSAKLGGKAPEYYLQPRNLLDNSDFRNPVNQRGITSWYAGIGIDRWHAWPSSSDYTAEVTDAGILVTIEGSSGTTRATLQQRMPKGTIDTSKTYTMAAYYNNGVIKIGHTGINDSGVGNPLIDTSIADFDFVNVYVNNGECVVWAALYEGAYTADTLPPYVPKGYAAELVECRRYYKHFINNAFLGTAIVSSDGRLIQGFIPLDTPMRSKNPAIIGTLAFYESTQNQTLGTPTTFVQQGNGIRCNWNLTTAITAKSTGFINALGDVGISDDL